MKYSGDLIIITTILSLAGIVLALAAVALFELINIPIGDLYLPKILVWSVAALPVIGTYLVNSNPQLVNNVSPVIAKVFSPLVLIVMVIYLVAIIYTGKDPYNDRDFLMVFNLLLIGVMAIIFFSVVEISKISESKTSGDYKINSLILFSLSAVTIIVNLIALSAIIFRISEWGLTPNRLTILGSNLLVLINLIIATYYLLQSFRTKESFKEVQNIIALFLPIYGLWALLVTFVFPLLFGYK